MADKRAMSSDHKAALAEGRQQGRAVRDYLEALEQHKPKRGRKRTVESMTAQLERIGAQIAEADPVTRLRLIQDRMDIEAAMASVQDKVDLEALENAFVAAAADYSKRKSISYAAWRELGVDAAVLKRAGIARTRS